jgi:hypothetical protein
MLDDTCYFIPCDSKSEAEFFTTLLNSETAQRFISSLVFMDAKRPVTIDVLKRIDLKKVAAHVVQESKAIEYLSSPSLESSHQRLLVFEKKEEYRTKKSTVPHKARGRASRVR